MVDYNYLKTWTSREQIRQIREEANLTRQQVYKIMKGTSKNFTVRNRIIEIAKKNEAADALNN